MKVSVCLKCPYRKRRKWSTYHRPAGYHPIGLSHVYSFCSKHNRRCSEVRKCEEVI